MRKKNHRSAWFVITFATVGKPWKNTLLKFMRERRLNALYVISGLLAWSSTYIEAVHEGKKPFKCTLCNQAWCNANFSKKGNLNVHIKSCNGQKHPTFQKCPLCPSIPFNLRKHMESTHDGFNSSILP